MLRDHVAGHGPNTDKRAAANEFRRQFDKQVAGYPELKKALGAAYSLLIDEIEQYGA